MARFLDLVMLNGWNKSRGFTIAEAAIAVGIVGVLLTASLTAMGGIAKARTLQNERRVAYELGQQLMAEILAQYFLEPGTSASSTLGPESGETRSTYDDVDDYNGFSETPPTRKDGTALSDYSGWTRSAAVAYVDPSNPTSVVSTSTLKRITVTVTAPAPSRKQYTLVGLRSQYGAYEYVPAAQTNFVTGVGIDVEAGGRVKNVRGGARPMNITASQ